MKVVRRTHHKNGDLSLRIPIEECEHLFNLIREGRKACASIRPGYHSGGINDGTEFAVSLMRDITAHKHCTVWNPGQRTEFGF